MVTFAKWQLNMTACEVLLQEIPGEVSLAYLISGCTLGCKGCHSSDSWSASNGEPLTLDRLNSDCERYQGLFSCVLFMGGEWQAENLSELLYQCKKMGLRTALYTGLAYCPSRLRPLLNYVKTGPWQAELGGLNNPGSNQRLYDLQRQLCLNPLLWPTPAPAYAAVPAFSPQ
jgi:anaerobic ribonucleoside-triphosphate reductase activating protein